MKILYIGCVTSSYEFLRSIVENTEAEIVGVITKMKSTYNADHYSLHAFCEEKKISWINYKDNEQMIEYIQSKQPDIIYCFGWSQLLPKEVYTLPRLGAVGYHPTLLPKNRGRHPIIWTIALGLKETGSTFFKLTELPDAGDILNQKKLKLDEFENAYSLYRKLITLGKSQVIEMTNMLMTNSIVPIKQNESEATTWRKRSKRDGLIDWRMDAQTILRLINALTKPYVGAHFEFNDQDIIVWEAEILNDRDVTDVEPGKVISVGSHNQFTIKTSNNLLKVNCFEGEFIPKVGMYL